MPRRLKSEILVKLREGGPITQVIDTEAEVPRVRLFRGGVPFTALPAMLTDLADEESIRMCFPRYGPQVRRRRERRKRPADRNVDHLLRIPLFRDVSAASLLELLRSLSDVEWAVLAPALAPPQQTTMPPDYTTTVYQGYLGDPGVPGVNAKHAWDVDGGNGDGVRIGVCDIRIDAHEDLPAIEIVGANPATAVGDPFARYALDESAHGTRVLGILASKHNGTGTSGIAHGADLAFSSVWSDRGLTGAIDDLLAEDGPLPLGPGDVLVMEAAVMADILEDGIYRSVAFPAEADPAVFLAIANAVEDGVIVVQCAGNGSASLQSAYSPNSSRTLYWSPASESGAIIVGAGCSASGSGLACSRLAESNHGVRVDCQGWGENVVTTTCDGVAADLFSGAPGRAYTKSFGGTSAATAIIGGVVACMQGAARASCGEAMAPARVRELVADEGLGTAQTGADRASKPIGPLPDLAAILPEVGDCPDVYIRDHLGDDGSAHTGELEAASPDIIVRGAAVADPNAAFGASTWGQDDLNEEPADGGDAFIYVRMKNRGTADEDVLLRLYWAEVGTFLTPESWHLLGQPELQGIVPGEVRVAGPFTWPAASIPAEGAALIAVAVSQTQASSFPEDFEDDADFQTYVREHNEIAYRTMLPELVVTARAAHAAVRRFRMRRRRRKIPPHVRPPRPGPRGPRGPRGRHTPVDPHGPCGLEILTNLPQGARIELTSAAFASSIMLTVASDRSYRFPNVGLMSDDAATVSAQVHLPPGTVGAYRITFRQLDGDSVTGAVTMRVRATV